MLLVLPEPSVAELIGTLSAVHEDARRIFICYRHHDSGYAASWLYHELCARIGDDGHVFIDQMLEPGVLFKDRIDEELSEQAVMLALIGPIWLTIKDKHGRRRLDLPDDSVAQEIDTALVRGIPVVPVLLDHTDMPPHAELPTALQGLPGRKGVTLSCADFRRDVNRLVAEIGRIPPRRTAPRRGPAAGAAPVLPRQPGRPSDITRDLMLAATAAPDVPKDWKAAEVLLIEPHCGPGERVVGVDFLSLGRREWCAAAVTHRHLFLAQDKGGRGWQQQLAQVPKPFRLTDKVIRIRIAAVDGPVSAAGMYHLEIHVHGKRGSIWSIYDNADVCARLDALLDRLAGGQRPKSAQRQEWEWEREAARRAAESRRNDGGIVNM